MSKLPLPKTIERRITKIIGHYYNCPVETGYEDNCNCVIRDLIKLVLLEKAAQRKEFEEMLKSKYHYNCGCETCETISEIRKQLK